MTERNLEWFAGKMMSGKGKRFPYEDLPVMFRHPMEQYICAGWMPGKLLKSVLENDLQATLIHGTREEKAELEPLLHWVQNFVPGLLWKRPGVVDEWVSAMEKAKGER